MLNRSHMHAACTYLETRTQLHLPSDSSMPLLLFPRQTVAVPQIKSITHIHFCSFVCVLLNFNFSRNDRRSYMWDVCVVRMSISGRLMPYFAYIIIVITLIKPATAATTLNNIIFYFQSESEK